MLIVVKKKLICKECKIEFNIKERLERHKIKAHPKKRRFVSPGEYWHDSGAGV